MRRITRFKNAAVVAGLVVPNRVNPLKRITGRRIREATPGIGMVRSVSVCVEAWSWSYAAVVVV